MARKIMKPDAIWKLCNLIDDEYIVRVGASDDVTVKRWQADPLSYLREGYQIEEMRSEHRDIVELALIEWKSRETIVLSLFEDSNDKFIEWFSSLHAAMWENKSINLHAWTPEDKILYKATEYSRLMVTNIVWCRAFGAFLPLSLPEIRPLLAKVGMMMSSIFYLEKMAKLRDQNGMKKQVKLDAKKFENINTYWLRAKELC